MGNKEYLTVAEIGKKNGMTSRNVRRIIRELAETKNDSLVRKNKLDQWEVHHLLMPKFKRKRKAKEVYFALSFKTYKGYSPEDIELILKNVLDRIDDPNLEINYTIELRKANGQPHVHSYIRTSRKRTLYQTLELLFANLSYYESKIFDLEGWKQYITKDGSQINKLRKDEDI
ncbi:hypothetical protein [Winogradskyella sp. A2]|uniref:hypothetical protein n=1 Tax=Winogradskyella sp. A2 TaxID=3366944 RepID=UPI00398C71B4